MEGSKIEACLGPKCLHSNLVVPQSRPESVYGNTLLTKPDCLTKTSIWKAWICLVASNVSSEAAAETAILSLQALGVDAKEVPHGTHVAVPDRLMDVPASGITVTARARLSITRIPCIDTPSGTGRP